MDGDSHPPEAVSRTEAFRGAMLAKIPRWYSPWGHLAGSVGVGVVAVAIAVPRVHALRAVELLTIPVAFLFANLIEWLAHRYLMHERRRPMTVLYDRHTPEHHRVYRYQNLAIADVRELRLVLIPALGVFGIVVVAALGAFAAAALTTPNVGWLFLATSAFYVMGYELSHLAYHLPETSPVYRLPLLRAAREHHARHHIPSLMQRRNFNVTIPLADLLFGTIASQEDVRRALAQGNERDG